MAEPKDIRRQTGDISPTNFINPGVKDTSTAEAVQKLGEIGMQLDATLAQERFGEAIETLRSQYMTGRTPQEAASAPSVVEEEQDDPEQDYVPTAMDKKALADFGATLDAHAQAVEQGVRSDDMFRIAAERLYRTAISKRPGLAREFRGIAQNFLGFDVVGASLQYEAEQDEAYIKSLADAKKTKEERAHDLIENERDYIGKTLKFVSALQVPDDQWAAWREANSEAIHKVALSGQAAALAEQEKTLRDLQGIQSEAGDTAYFVAQAEAVSASYATAADQALSELQQVGPDGKKLIDSPEAVRRTITGLQVQLTKEAARLESLAASRKISPEVRSRWMGQLEADKARIAKTISLQNDKEFIDTSISLMRAMPIRKLLSNEQTAMMQAVDGLFRNEKFMDKFLELNGKQAALTISQILTDNMSPNQVARYGSDSVGQLIASIWPDGSNTPPDPIAAGAAAEGIAKILTSYYLQDDGNFRPVDFTSWEGREGILPKLTQRAPQILPSLSPDGKQQIAAQIAAASGNSALRLVSLLQKKSPALWEKLDPASVWQADTPGLASPKPGATLTASEQQVLNHFSRQFNRTIITKAMAAYTDGASAPVIWQEIAQSVRPMLLARARAVEVIPETPQEGAGGLSREGAGRGVQGPAPGTVIGDFRYKGGDPNSQTSWEKVR